MANLNGQDDSGSWKRDTKANIVRLLIKHGADVVSQDRTRSTPLHMAATSGSAETVRLCIEHGADVNAKDETHLTPLHLASSLVSATSASLLIQRRADVNDRLISANMALAGPRWKLYSY